MRNRIVSVEVPHFPVLRVKFQDGIEGDLDLGEEIRTMPMFEELRDEQFFRKVALGDKGRCLGWKLDKIGEEIDLSADGIRTDIETQIVKRWAEDYRASRKAAE